MKRILFLFSCLIFSTSMLLAQDKEEKKVKKIKIVTIDEDGKETEIVKEIDMDGQNFTWSDSEGGNTHVIIKKNGDVEEEIIINMPSEAHWEMDHGGAFLGVMLGDVTDEGILIDGVTEESAAEKAGLIKGDIIVEVDGDKVLKSKGLVEIISNHEAGEEVKIGYLRDGKKKSTSAVLTERNHNVAFAMHDMNENIVIEIDGEDGMVFYGDEIDDNKAFLGVQPAEVKDIEGVMLLKAVEGSAAEKAGLQTGDVITEIDNSKILDFDGLVAALENKKPGDKISITYSRQGKVKSAKVELTPRKGMTRKHKVIKIEEHEEKD